MPDNMPVYGGQAVIEGVMMRGRQTCAIAVRAPDNSIQTKELELGSIYRSSTLRIPFLRGLLLLWDALGLGMRALAYSANVQADEGEQIQDLALGVTMVLSILAGLGLFFLIPAGTAHLIGDSIGTPGWLTNLTEGFIRLSILIGYIWAIGRMPDIERVYGYHGAEHKTINAFEAGAPLTIETVQKYSREHPRCGTAFLLTLVILSVIVFTLLGPMPLLPRLATRLLLIPLLAGIAYEYLRLTAMLIDRPWARPILAPNLVIQRLTTREPEDGMVEVAIRAFHAMREREPAADTESQAVVV